MVYVPSSIQTSVDTTGDKPIETGWSDTNKGDARNLQYRSRLEAKEFKWLAKRLGKTALFAGAPPAECLRILISLAVARVDGDADQEAEDPTEILVVDVKRALLCARTPPHLREDASRGSSVVRVPRGG